MLALCSAGRLTNKGRLKGLLIMADESGIVFHDDGRASEPCCWSCKDFTICLGGEQYCVRRETQVDRGDLCNRWIPRDLSWGVSDEVADQTDESPSESEGPSSISVGSVMGTVIIGLGIFVLVRYGETWAESLESRLGIPYGVWLVLFILGGIGFVLMTLLVIATISARIEAASQQEAPHSEGDRESGEIAEKVRKCINCGAAIPEGRLQCPSCGSSRFIWE